MRIGCCCNIEDAPIAHAAGFDFIECRVTALLPETDDDTVAPILAQHKASPLPVAAFNVFVPKEIKIVAGVEDEERLWRYVDNGLPPTLPRRLVAGIVVFGNGTDRTIPDGFSAQEARSQTVRFLHHVADAAERNGITVVIEPLNRKETNTIFTIDEGVELARAVNRPTIQVLADFYHMDEEEEPLSHLGQYAASDPARSCRRHGTQSAGDWALSVCGVCGAFTPNAVRWHGLHRMPLAQF